MRPNIQLTYALIGLWLECTYFELLLLLKLFLLFNLLELGLVLARELGEVFHVAFGCLCGTLEQTLALQIRQHRLVDA